MVVAHRRDPDWNDGANGGGTPPCFSLAVPMLLPLLFACTPKDADDSASVATPEPLNLPADPAENGVPVGVTTVEANGQTIEVWYPAADSAAGQPTELADYASFIPAVVTDVLGVVTFPAVDSGAIRDAPVRVPVAPYPVVVFSHGFGGMRIQSLDYAVHLASRGYVVVAADHPGRMLGDVLPCMFSPALEGCDLSGFTGADPAVEDVTDVVAWVESAATGGMFAGRIDPAHMALTGHSAGGGTVQTAGDADVRFTALLSMAAGAQPTRDVPLLLMDGSCDGVVPVASVTAAHEAVIGSALVDITGAGHLAFSDLCELDLLGFGNDLLAGRDDVNTVLLDQLLLLASDGCPGGTPVPEACSAGFLPIATSDPIVRYYSTVFLDEALKGEGPGVTAGVYAEAVVDR